MTAKRDRSLDEVAVWARLPAFLQQRRQFGQKLLVRKPRKPRIVEHDQIVSAGARFEIYQFFLKKICVRKLGDVDVDAGLRFVIERGLFERIAFNAGNHGQRELFASLVVGSGYNCDAELTEQRQRYALISYFRHRLTLMTRIGTDNIGLCDKS